MSFEGKSQQEPRNWQMDRILIILKKENGPRASSVPALGLNTIMFKHVYWYMQQTQVSVYRTIGPLVFCILNKLYAKNDMKKTEPLITLLISKCSYQRKCRWQIMNIENILNLHACIF